MIVELSIVILICPVQHTRSLPSRWKTFSSENFLAGLFFSEGPRWSLHPFLAQLKALQRVCWMGCAKKIFFRNFLNHLIHKNIASKKMQIFLHFHKKDSPFCDKKFFAPKITCPKSVPVYFKFDMYTVGLRGIRTWEIYFLAVNSTTEPQWLLCLV